MAKGGQLFLDLHHLAVFSLFEVQRIDEFLSMMVLGRLILSTLNRRSLLGWVVSIGGNEK